MSLAWVCRPENNRVFIVTAATHHLQLRNIWEVLLPTEHRWHLLIQILVENWVFVHNIAVSPSGAGINSFADFSAIALQISNADFLFQGPVSRQAWLKDLLWLTLEIGCSYVLFNQMLSGFWVHRLCTQLPNICILYVGDLRADYGLILQHTLS